MISVAQLFVHNGKSSATASKPTGTLINLRSPALECLRAEPMHLRLLSKKGGWRQHTELSAAEPEKCWQRAFCGAALSRHFSRPGALRTSRAIQGRARPLDFRIHGLGFRGAASWTLPSRGRATAPTHAGHLAVARAKPAPDLIKLLWVKGCEAQKKGFRV